MPFKRQMTGRCPSKFYQKKSALFSRQCVILRYMRYITTTKYSLFATSRTRPCIVLNYCLKIPNFYAVESGSKMALFQKHAKKPIFCSLLFSYSYFKSFCVNYRLYFIYNIISHYITFNIFKMKFNRKNISVPVYMR